MKEVFINFNLYRVFLDFLEVLFIYLFMVKIVIKYCIIKWGGIKMVGESGVVGRMS